MTALRGLASATSDPRVKHTVEKIARVSKPEDQGIVLDFSVLRELKITDQPFEKEHEPASEILEKMDRIDSRSYTRILIKCAESAKMRVVEYLKGTIVQEFPDGGALIQATVVENEQFWLGTLLSLGDKAEIIAPEEIRRRVLDSAEKIVSLYKKL